MVNRISSNWFQLPPLPLVASAIFYRKPLDPDAADDNIDFEMLFLANRLTDFAKL